MIDLYYWTTPNGHKISIMLEEAKLAYRVNLLEKRLLELEKEGRVEPDKNRALSPEDQRLSHHIYGGILRHRRRLDLMIGGLSKQPITGAV